MNTIARIFAAFVLVALFSAIVVGFFYGGYRIIRKQDWGALVPFLLLWLIGFGWAYGLWYVLGPDREYRQEVRAAKRGEGYHPDYKRLGT